MSRIRRQNIRGTDNYVVRGGTRDMGPTVVLGKSRANEVMAARRRVVEHRAERARRSR